LAHQSEQVRRGIDAGGQLATLQDYLISAFVLRRRATELLAASRFRNRRKLGLDRRDPDRIKIISASDFGNAAGGLSIRAGRMRR
jgi:hypothetical protein